MANQTIYPYGTGGQLPSSIGLSPLYDLVTTATDILRPTYTTGYKLGNYQWAIGETRTQDPKSNSTGKWAKMAVLAGDRANVWGCVGSADYLWALCDTSNKVVDLGVKGNGNDMTTVTEADPAVVNVTVDGWLYLSTVTTAAYGCKVMREHPALQIADSTHDGIMSTEQVEKLEAAGGEDIDILKSYLEDTNDNIVVEYTQGKAWDNHNYSEGNTYQGSMVDKSGYACAKVNVFADDQVTLWAGAVSNTNYPYLLCNKNNVITVASPKSTSATFYSIPQSDPAEFTVAEDGYLYIAALIEGGYGCTITRPKRAFIKATSERDGLMPKEIMALFGDEGSVGGSEVSLKLKTFGFIGDSFSASGTWQSTMCSDLGAISSSNKSIDGCSWWGTGTQCAYYRAGELISTGRQYDYILCVLGTNDIAHWNNNNPDRQLGDIVISETIGTEEGNVNPNGSITGGIQATLIRLKNAFPNAIIKIGYTPAGYIHDAYDTLYKVYQLIDRLKELSHIYGVGYIETRDCGICKWMEADLHAYTGRVDDGVWSPNGHPSGAGQIRIGHYMARIMMSNL